jgi:hypothetical protein
LKTALENLDLGGEVGLEFVRSLNRSAVTGIILTPAAASLLFAIVWISVWIPKGKDAQTVVSTAFTIASYLVTAGMSSS